jgi:hypothetical protein
VSARPLNFTHRPFQTLVCVAIGQDSAHRCMPENLRKLEHIQKRKVMDMVLKQVLLTGRDHSQAICWSCHGIATLV